MVEDIIENEDSLIHDESEACNCINCQKKKSPYIQLFDIDSIVDNLEDWD